MCGPLTAWKLASFHELKLVDIFSVVFLVVVNGFKFFCVLCFLS